MCLSIEYIHTHDIHSYSVMSFLKSTRHNHSVFCSKTDTEMFVVMYSGDDVHKERCETNESVHETTSLNTDISDQDKETKLYKPHTSDIKFTFPFNKPHKTIQQWLDHVQLLLNNGYLLSVSSTFHSLALIQPPTTSSRGNNPLKFSQIHRRLIQFLHNLHKWRDWGHTFMPDLKPPVYQHKKVV